MLALLNGDMDHRGCAKIRGRMVRLVEGLHEMVTAMRPIVEISRKTRKNFWKAGKDDAPAEWHRIWQIVKRLMPLTNKVKITPSFQPSHQNESGIAAVDVLGTGTDPLEFETIECLRKMLLTNTLPRLTKCLGCGERWMFQWKKNQKWCGQKCRQRNYENSEERREARRKYMRDRYHKYQRKMFLATKTESLQRGKEGRKRKPTEGASHAAY